MTRIAFFDFDSTLIEQEIIDELSARVGKKDEMSRLTKETMEGKYTFGETFRRRISLLRGVTESDLDHVAREIRYRKNIESLFSWLDRWHFKTCVISGTFGNVLFRLPYVNRFDFVFVNQLETIDGVVTGRFIGRVMDNKGQIARELQEKLDVRPNECFAVGDGSTDIPVFNRCGFSIAINAKPKVKSAASVALDTSDLAELIPALERWLQNRVDLSIS